MDSFILSWIHQKRKNFGGASFGSFASLSALHRVARQGNFIKETWAGDKKPA